MTTMKKIILASGSPRRKELLEKIGLKFDVEPADYAEDIPAGLTYREIAQKLSLEKAKAVAANHTDAIIIGADTFGIFEGKILGKPHHAAQAKKMLTMLGGKSHTVMTGYTIIDSATGKTATGISETAVHFRRLSEEEIDAYIKTGEPLDKAGAYAIQGLGALLVDRIEGDYYNVIGLPLCPLMEDLKKFGVKII
jgi:septum formation protein